MATAHDPGPTEAELRARVLYGPGPSRLRWTGEQYERLAETGFLGDRRVELIDGDLIEMSPASPPHAIAIELATAVYPATFGAGFRVRLQLPLDLGPENRLEPDVAVLAGSARDSADHPTTALLVVEVSDSSLGHDRRVKARHYATAGVPEYWILNLVERQLEVYRRPGVDPEDPRLRAYAEMTTIPANGHASPLAKPGARIAVADLLP